MTELEELIRETLADRASRAPSADGLVEGVRHRRRRRRATRTAFAVAAVAVATATAVVVPLTLGDHGTTKPAEKPTTPPAPASDEQVIGYHGLEITVPVSWHINDTRCGTPVSNTVVRDTGGTLACAVGRPKGISSVELLDNPSDWIAHIRNLQSTTNREGVTIQRGSIPHRPGAVVVVPSVGVLMFVDTTTTAMADGIVDSIRLADRDVTGCSMREHQLNPPSRGGSDQSGPLALPPAPSSITICHYSDFWLMSAVTVTGQTAANIVRLANAAEPGWAHGAGAPSEAACGKEPPPTGELGAGYILFLHYADGPTVTAWAHIGTCGRLGITTGLATGALTLELAQAINRPLGVGFGLPGRLLPGPGPR